MGSNFGFVNGGVGFSPFGNSGFIQGGVGFGSGGFGFGGAGLGGFGGGFGGPGFYPPLGQFPHRPYGNFGHFNSGCFNPVPTFSPCFGPTFNPWGGNCNFGRRQGFGGGTLAAVGIGAGLAGLGIGLLSRRNKNPDLQVVTVNGGARVNDSNNNQVNSDWSNT